tara:strand:- start:528 stop:785 length:258 start_codon:yes stop_codon:yes gene_type:complete
MIDEKKWIKGKHKWHRGMHIFENGKEMKRCHTCQMFKPLLKEFLNDNSTWDKYSCKCINCYYFKSHLVGYPPYITRCGGVPNNKF